MRIVLVDDHALFRKGVRRLLSDSSDYEVVGEAATARSAFGVVDALMPDIVLMDISMPGMDGVLATREIGRRAPKTRVLIVTAYDHVNDVLDALAAGAGGYVLKSDPPETLLEALRSVGSGERYIAPALAGRLPQLDKREQRDGDVLAVLSIREREVFRLAAQCERAQDIARELCIARKTVDTHLNRINRKLKLRNLAELVRLAATMGMVHSTRTSPAEIQTDADE